jgi:hypothetical protein
MIQQSVTKHVPRDEALRMAFHFANLPELLRRR